jgi:hypothetical protein
MGRRIEGCAADQCRIKALVRVGRPRAASWRICMEWGTGFPRVAVGNLALRWRHVCVDRVLVGGGDCSCERAGCQRRGGNSSCAEETCRAR